MGSTGRKVALQGQPQTNNVTESNSDWDAYRALNDADASAFVDALSGSSRNRNDPDNGEMNPTSSLQALVHKLNLHGKPTVLSDADFDNRLKNDALDGYELYRGFGYQPDSGVIDAFKNGNTTYIGDGIHGGGIYFTTRKRYASHYFSGDANNATVTAFIDKNKARVIDENVLRNQFSSLPPSLKRQYSGISGDIDDGISNYALHQGYNVIRAVGGNSRGKHNTSTGDFYVALTRDIFVVRQTTKVK